MPMSVAESPLPSSLAAWGVLLLLLVTLMASPLAAQERRAVGSEDRAGAADGDGEGGEADTAPQQTTTEAEAPVEQSGFQLAFGLGLAPFVIPVESDFTAEALAPDVYMDMDLGSWIGLRLGINNAETKQDELTLRTTTVYLAYRHGFQLTGAWWADLFAGAASSDAVLSSAQAELTASGSGYMLGAGAWRRMGQFDVGLRYQLLFTDSDFSGIAVNTGSNQVQLTAAYRLF